MQRPEGAWMSAKTRNAYDHVDEGWAGRLLFAGEGCSIDGHQCVHGAFETGQNQARKVLSALESGASGAAGAPFASPAVSPPQGAAAAL